jgi:hypothetical protein
MTKLQQRYQTALHDQRLMHEEVALKAILSPNSLRNIINGVRASNETRRRIQRACGKQLWDDLPIERTYVFEQWTSIEFIGAEPLAADFAREFAGQVKRQGATITFTKPTVVTIGNAPTESQAAEAIA